LLIGISAATVSYIIMSVTLHKLWILPSTLVV